MESTAATTRRAAPGGALNPATPLRARWQRWWQARLPPGDSLLLTQRNVYILPSASGCMLALTLLALLIASINYQLNLGYLLTFLLAGSVLAGMCIGHANLRGIRLQIKTPEPHFLGASTVLELQLSSDRRSQRHGIALSVQGAGRAGRRWAWTDLPAQGQASVQLAFKPARRGLQALPALLVETRFPLGSFRVWAYWRPAAQVLVYPTPEQPAPPLPAGELAGGGGAAAHGSGEFDGLRAYRRGDPPKRVLWKKAAKALASGSGELLCRDDAEPARQRTLWLDWARAALPEPEARLARLSAWVLQADRLGLDYGLRLPGVQIAPGAGVAHKRRCLEALALCPV